MAGYPQTMSDSAKKIKKVDTSLPNLLAADIHQSRRGSTGAAWPTAGQLQAGSASISDALLLVSEGNRPRSKSCTPIASTVVDQQAGANLHARKAHNYTTETDAHTSGGLHGGEDVVDARLVSADPARLKADIDQLKSKIQSTMKRIHKEQTTNEDNVTWYLSKSDGSPSSRAKAEFEKNNQKSAAAISHLQKKLDVYRSKLRDLEQRLPTSTPSASSASSFMNHARPGHKNILRDVGNGLREFGENIKDGVLGSLAVVPFDIRRGMKKMFGSADNLLNLPKNDSLEKNMGTRSVAGSGSGGSSVILHNAPKKSRHAATGRPGIAYSDDDKGLTGKAASQESLLEDRSDMDSLLVRSASSGQFLSARHRQISEGERSTAGEAAAEKAREQLEWVRRELEHLKGQFNELMEEVGPLRAMVQDDHYRCLRLEEHLHDITDLYPAEMASLKQELANVQEKLEYEMEERARDLQEDIENCHNKISKMELQGQRQQQVVNMEGVSNATARVLATKFANIVLSLIVVILLCISTLTKIIYPFFNSRWKSAVMLGVIGAAMVMSSHWHGIRSWAASLLDYYTSTNVTATA